MKESQISKHLVLFEKLLWSFPKYPLQRTSMDNRKNQCLQDFWIYNCYMSPHRVRIVGPWKKPPICDRRSNTDISVIDHFFTLEWQNLKTELRYFLPLAYSFCFPSVIWRLSTNRVFLANVDNLSKKTYLLSKEGENSMPIVVINI